MITATIKPKSRTPCLETVGRLARWLLLPAVSCLGLVGSLWATSVVPPSFDELVNQSDCIVRAVVKSVAPEERTMPDGSKLIFSQVELEVKQVVAGRPPSPLVLTVLGGKWGGREMAISGAPKFRVGEESIFFVQGNGMQIFPLVRMMHGLYRVQREGARGREYMARSDGQPLQDVSEVSRPVHGAGEPAQGRTEAAARALTPDDFVQHIRARVKEPHLIEH